MQSFEANLRRVRKACTEGIEDREGLDLTSIGFFVDNYRRIDISSKRLPVFDLAVDDCVSYLLLLPVLSLRETLGNTSLHLIPIQS